MPKVPSLLVATDKEELNLRRYRVIGGLIHFDLLHIPPQPKVVGAWTLREGESLGRPAPPLSCRRRCRCTEEPGDGPVPPPCQQPG